MGYALNKKEIIKAKPVRISAAKMEEVFLSSSLKEPIKTVIKNYYYYPQKRII